MTLAEANAAYFRGRTAARTGRARWANPYDVDDARCAQWATGYNEAAK